jgi:uncharacterized protein YecE (DUF72 family)
MMREDIWIGTSGWSYDDWRARFFPKTVAKKDWLRWYSQVFPTTEINASFYRTPSLEAVRAWREQTPRGFRFAWKASKFITHWKRLGPTCPNSIALMVSRLDALKPKVGPVLFQLPARFKPDRERLRAFLKMLPRRRFQYAFEFRDPGWFESDILSILERHDISLCISDHRDAVAPWVATANHVYVRGHGPRGNYRDRYARSTLLRWAAQIEIWRREKKTVYCYFDNDTKSCAPADARSLVDILGLEKTMPFNDASEDGSRGRRLPASHPTPAGYS